MKKTPANPGESGVFRIDATGEARYEPDPDRRFIL
jgi:hypothetical protein